MVFSSLTFLIFFSIVAGLMALTNIEGLQKHFPAGVRELRHDILLLASYVFYGWWNWKCCLLMLMLTVVAWYCANSYSETGKKPYITVGVVFPLVILGIFKYFNFFVDSFCAAFGIVQGGSLNILLPVGISFYTFQSLSYTIDVYRGQIPTEKSFKNVALYIAFFPQLVAGPIVKAGDFIPQLHEDRTITLEGLEKGVQYFAFGLFKKLVIADNLSVFEDAVFANPNEFHAVSIMLAMVCYSIQIYCDFSGYSDMAVGCAKCLGYDLQRNFNLPFLSRNLGNLWKRWHISLSSWLMEYLYIPLGGNRKGKVRTYVNLFLVMLIGGLWHGAAWTFVAWGALHGIGLCIFRLRRKGKKEHDQPVTSVTRTLLSAVWPFIFFALCAVFFRSDSFETALQMFRGLLRWNGGVIQISSWAILSIVFITGAELIAVIRCKRLHVKLDGFYPTVKLNTIPGLTVFFLFVGITLGLAYTGQNPFIYFQF